MKKWSTTKSNAKPIDNYSITNDNKESIRLSSYIGKKGYTIPKTNLPKLELDFLKKDLFLKPIIPGANFGNDNSTPFPVYRENDNKIYI